jgi:hypothetical protein
MCVLIAFTATAIALVFSPHTRKHPQPRVAEQVKVCAILSLVVGHNGKAD